MFAVSRNPVTLGGFNWNYVKRGHWRFHSALRESVFLITALFWVELGVSGEEAKHFHSHFKSTRRAKGVFSPKTWVVGLSGLDVCWWLYHGWGTKKRQGCVVPRPKPCGSQEWKSLAGEAQFKHFLSFFWDAESSPESLRFGSFFCWLSRLDFVVGRC